jgi:hypothetical protein
MHLQAGEILKRLLLFGVFAALTVMAFLLEQRGIWSGLQLLLGVGAVLVFELGWSRGVSFNLPKAVVFSLFVVTLLYLLLDLVFPGSLAYRLGDWVAEPYVIGVVVALLLSHPRRIPSA